MDELPSEYSYIHVPNYKYTSFRIKEVKDKESVKTWVNKYSDETKTTWRIKSTFPNCGKTNLYKIKYRCCHNTDRRTKGTRPSKHTGCAAVLVITINRFIENSKYKANMKLIESHPCLVLLHNEHNHDLNSAESLKYRDLLPAVKEQLIGLFHQGHGPASALKTYKTDLMSDLGDQYYIAEADRRTMPTYSMVHKIFESIYPRSSNTLYKDYLTDTQYQDHQADTQYQDDQADTQYQDDQADTQYQDHLAYTQYQDHEDRTVIELLPSSSNAFDNKVEEVCKRLTEFCNKLIEQVRENAEDFLPAAEKMLDNSNKLTDADLLTAMYTFGTYCGMNQNVSKTIVRRCHKTMIGVQVRAIARRKRCLPGKKRIRAGKPRGQTTNKSAPNRKRKTPCDYQPCFYGNNTVGNTNHGKQ